ncbi:Hypothetical protein A7982_01615 [Minicystis rosea]|nr:Hypothetical protein A7982_01615 [Minicystis rosea]
MLVRVRFAVVVRRRVPVAWLRGVTLRFVVRRVPVAPPARRVVARVACDFCPAAVRLAAPRLAVVRLAPAAVRVPRAAVVFLAAVRRPRAVVVPWPALRRVPAAARRRPAAGLLAWARRFVSSVGAIVSSPCAVFFCLLVDFDLWLWPLGIVPSLGSAGAFRTHAHSVVEIARPSSCHSRRSPPTVIDAGVPAYRAPERPVVSRPRKRADARVAPCSDAVPAPLSGPSPSRHRARIPTLKAPDA